MTDPMAGVDLTDLDNFSHGFPHEIFARHRASAPVYWHEATEHTPGGEGFWSVASYDCVLEVLNDPISYSSDTGGDREYGGTLIIDLPVAGAMLNMTDDPRHARIRRLVTKGLTPKTIRCLEDDLRGRTATLLGGLPDDGEFDFVRDVAGELPMQAICFLLGVPEVDRYRLFEAAELVFDFRDDRAYFDFTPEQTAAMEWLFDYGADLIQSKRTSPGSDMLSEVVHAHLADLDPPNLTDTELHSFFTLLFSAGSETTRNALAGGLLALLERPDQFEALRDSPELLGGAVEEVLRWTTPSPMKRRTATREVELGGQSISAGEKVVVWEGSANRDEIHFVDPMTFDIARSPNPHLSFGHGVHFCLGAHLARLEMQVVFSEFFDAFGEVQLAGDVESGRSNRHTGFRRMPLRAVRR